MLRLLLSLALSLALGTLPASGDEPTRLTFAQLSDALKANLEVTQHIKSYNGKEVEIQGFILPAGPPDLSFFLLSRVSSIGNYCCELPAGQDETVFVLTTKGARVFYDPLRVYKVRGVFEAGASMDPVNGLSLFRLRQAQVEEATGAKIMQVDEAAVSAAGQTGTGGQPRPTADKERR